MELDGYEWLETIGVLPRMVQEGLKTYGIVETPGSANSPVIMSWATRVGKKAIGWEYTKDETPWCGLWMAYVALMAEKPVVPGPLYALNWAAFGSRTHNPVLGDVLTFKRTGGGHVGLYIGEDESAYHVLGGNQSDKVCFTRIAKSRLYQARRTPYHNMPASCKAYNLKGGGALSVNEA